jgi:5-methylcytosine-specific restriction endonuclease McrA
MKPLNDITGQVFGRITVISRAQNPGTRKNDTAAYWNCHCTCGKDIVLRGYSLTSGKAHSCGCLKRESPHLAAFSGPKYSPDISAAHLVWGATYKEMPFEEYYPLSQQPCHYCNQEPSLIKEAILKNKSNIVFKYNTLDRIDSNKRHTINNVVPCCKNCNRAKSDYTYEEFLARVDRLIHNIDRVSPSEYRSKCHSILNLDSWHPAKIATLKSLYKGYHDGNLDMAELYSLIMSNCYYCCAAPSNTKNIYNRKNRYSSPEYHNNGFIIYNGLDRVNNDLPHNYSNVVPCCYACNFAKSNLTITEFGFWIKRLADYQLISSRPNQQLPLVSVLA